MTNPTDRSQKPNVHEAWTLVATNVQCAIDLANRCVEGLRAPEAPFMEQEAAYSLEKITEAAKYLERAKRAVKLYELVRRSTRS
jgi:hypothetical protein